MNTITLHTSDNYTFWVKRGGHSELLFMHLTHGERKVYGITSVEDYKVLAKAHGWAIQIEMEEK